MQINPRHVHLACCTDSLASLMLHMVEFHTQRHDCLLAHVRTHVYLPSLFTFRVCVHASCKSAVSARVHMASESNQGREVRRCRARVLEVRSPCATVPESNSSHFMCVGLTRPTQRSKSSCRPTSPPTNPRSSAASTRMASACCPSGSTRQTPSGLAETAISHTPRQAAGFACLDVGCLGRLLCCLPRATTTTNDTVSVLGRPLLVLVLLRQQCSTQ
jgi:hypothetical protein